MNNFIERQTQATTLFFKSVGVLFSTAPCQSALLVVAVLLQGILPSATIWLSAFIINTITKSHDLSATYLVLICLAWGGTLLCSNLLEPWVMYWRSNIADKAVYKINYEIINKSNAIKGLNIFEKQEYHDDIQILQSQASNKPINLVITVVGLARDFVLIASSLALLFMLIPWISIVTLVSAYINYKVISIFQEKTWQESLGRSIESRKMQYISSVSIGAQYAKEIRFFNFGSYLINLYANSFNKIYQRMNKIRLKQAYWPIVPLVISVLGNLTAFYFVVLNFYHGHAGVGSLILFLQTLTQLHLCVTSFGEQAGWVKGHLLFFKKFFNFLNCNEEVYVETIENRRLISQDEPLKIQFKDVSFHYSNGSNVVSNLNFTIYPNEKIAIVGLNGAGKSTFIKLLCGLYAPYEGEILVNDIPLDQVDLTSWRKLISPLFQDFNLFNLSIEDNIVMGDPELKQSKIDLALKEAGLSNFVSHLPDGVHSLIGKDFGGTELSKGQAQKLALARAIYKDAPIYIFDEPTSALDPISEYEIFSQFVKNCHNKTVIFVTHRLGCVAVADKILVLDNGGLVDAGRHHELLGRCQIYKTMYDMQAENYVSLMVT